MYSRGEKPTGEKYVKDRYVCNLKPANSQIDKSMLANDLKYDFKTAETVFSDLQSFQFLMQASAFSIVDKKDFYRQIITNPSFTSIIFSNNKFYLDLCAKQGHVFSSSYAQMISNLLDHFFNQKYKEKMYSLQDDSLIFHFDGSRLPLTEILNFNSQFGFELNPLKTIYFSSNVTWSGYTFDASSKTICIPEEKIIKLRNLGKAILSNNVSSRRSYAKFLGKIYSYRLIAAGLRANFSILTYKIRKHMFKNTSQFYECLKSLTHFTKEYLTKYADFFDENIQPDAKYLENQINFLLEIFSRPVNFADVRNHIFTNNYINTSTSFSYLFVDASLKGYGFILYSPERNYAFNVEFPRCRVLDCASINFKELYAIFIALIFCIELVKSGYIESNNFLIFTDNEAGKSISYTKKANLRSDNLLQLAEATNYFQMKNTTNFYFDRISTSDNVIADYASRNFDDISRKFSELMGIFTFQFVVENFCNKSSLHL